jgi:hypothetical protein
MKKFFLFWSFTNGHQWHQDFATLEEAQKAALDFGLYTHPNIDKVEIKELEA